MGVFAVGCGVFSAGIGAVDWWSSGAFFVVEGGVAVGAGAGFCGGVWGGFHGFYCISS